MRAALGVAVVSIAAAAAVGYRRREELRHRALIYLIGDRPVVANMRIPKPAPVLVAEEAARGLLLNTSIDGYGTAVRFGSES